MKRILSLFCQPSVLRFLVSLWSNIMVVDSYWTIVVDCHEDYMYHFGSISIIYVKSILWKCKKKILSNISFERIFFWKKCLIIHCCVSFVEKEGIHLVKTLALYTFIQRCIHIVYKLITSCIVISIQVVVSRETLLIL